MFTSPYTNAVHTFCIDIFRTYKARYNEGKGKTDKKRWEDNVKECVGLKLGEALQKAENRKGWRKVVARSSNGHLD